MSIWLAILAVVVLAFGFVAFRGAPYVPSRRKEINEAFDKLYRLGSRDVLVDIGSGDGIVLRHAAARGARAIGYELNPILVVLSRWLSRKQPNVTVQLADFWKVQLPDETTIVYVFGDSRDITKMTKKFQDEATRIGKPLMFLSYGIAVPDLEHHKKLGAYFLYRLDPLHYI